MWLPAEAGKGRGWREGKDGMVAAAGEEGRAGELQGVTPGLPGAPAGGREKEERLRKRKRKGLRPLGQAKQPFRELFAKSS